MNIVHKNHKLQLISHSPSFSRGGGFLSLCGLGEMDFTGVVGAYTVNSMLLGLW